MSKGVAAVALAIAMLASVGAAAQSIETRKDKHDKVVKLLMKKERPTEAQIRAVSHDVDSVLADIINNRDMDSLTRTRAVACLRFFQNKRATQLLRSIITDPAWQKPFRQAALIAIASSMGVEALDILKEFTRDPDAEIRRACVQGLEVMDGEQALRLLKDLQLRERDPVVIEAIDKAIRELSRSPLEVH